MMSKFNETIRDAFAKHADEIRVLFENKAEIDRYEAIARAIREQSGGEVMQYVSYGRDSGELYMSLSPIDAPAREFMRNLMLPLDNRLPPTLCTGWVWAWFDGQRFVMGVAL